MGAVIIRKDEAKSAEKVGALLLSGSVGVLPCDTIYGLSGCVGEHSENRIFEIKNRPRSKSLITLMTLSDLEKSSLIVPEDIKRLWPSPLTAIVLDENDGKTVALRIPDDSYIQRVMEICGAIYSTSVNFSGEKSLLSFQDILPVFSSLVDFIVEDDEVSGGLPSTLIDTTVKPYKILRQGSYRLNL